MDLDQAKKICHPYGIGVEVAPPYGKLFGGVAYISYGLLDEAMGCGFAFCIKEGISAKELENLALNWCIENSFK